MRDLRTQEDIRYVALPGNADSIPTALAVSGDGRLIAWHDVPSQQITVWDIDGFAVVRRFQAGGPSLDDVALSFDGQRLATSSSDGSARLWDMRYTEEVGSVADQTTVRVRGPSRVTLSRAGDRVALSYSDGIVISDVGLGRRTRAACALLDGDSQPCLSSTRQGSR
jgi:WD40 repeat protein